MDDRAELSCPRCKLVIVCGPGQMLDWLRKARMVRRDTAPEPDLIGELLRSAAGKLVCPKCSSVGLRVRALPEENDEDWGMARACEGCGQPITRDRLEAVPDARLCVECQGHADRGMSTEPAEYCPRCGNKMTMRPTRGSGITRYTMACPACRH